MSGPVAAFPPGFRERVIRNTVYGIGGRLVGLAVPLILIPYTVHHLGSSRYALYALASTVTGYLSLLDLGLGAGYIKYVAEAAARDDHEGMNEVLSSGFFAYLGFGAVIALLWWILRHRIVAGLGIEPQFHAEAITAFTVAVSVLALSGAAAAYRAVLYGLQHIDTATRIGVALILPKVLLVVAALELGTGVIGLVVADAILFLLGSAALALASRAFFPALSIRPSRVTRAAFKRLLGYGTQLQVSRFSEMINFHLDKLLLARYVGLASVTEYDLAAKVVATARSFPLLLVNALVPAVSELEARGSVAGIERVAARSLRVLLLAATPLFAVVAVLAPQIMEVWIGPGHGQAALAVRVLAAGYLLNVASGAFTSVTQGIARNDYQMWLALVGLGANLVLSITLVQWFGFAGVIAGTGLSLAIAYVYADLAFRRLLRTALGGVARWPLRYYLGPLLAAAIAAALATGFLALTGWPEPRALRALVLGGGALVLAVGYLLALVLTRGLERADLELARESFRSLRPRG